MRTIFSGFNATLAGLVAAALMISPLHAAQIDWRKVSRLQGMEFLAYVWKAWSSRDSRR